MLKLICGVSECGLCIVPSAPELTWGPTKADGSGATSHGLNEKNLLAPIDIPFRQQPGEL